MDAKKQQIMNAAIKVVTLYGFRRTSMDDVAKAAGISRPALYQYFRNKDDIFTSGMDMVIGQGFKKAEAVALEVNGPANKVSAFLASYMCFYYRIVVAGPHGAEILEMNSILGPEKTDNARARLVIRLNQLAGLPDDDEAGYILAHASEGLKFRAPDEPTLTRRITALVGRYLD